jgi:hypothetical protein
LKRRTNLKPKPKKKEEQTENSEEVQNQEEEQSDLQKFVATALRQPKGGIYEQLLSQFLAQAVIVTDPLKRVKVVCEAALMIPKPERKNLAIDYEKIEVLNAVANALLSPTSRRSRWAEDDIVSIAWGFPGDKEENVQKFIFPWYKGQISYYPTLLQKHIEFYTYSSGRVICDNNGLPKIKRIIYEPAWSWFLEASQCLGRQGYELLRNAFIMWAIPQVQLYLAELTQVVNPNVYAEVLGLYTRNSKRSYAEKVKDATKPPEGSTDET